MIGSGIKALNYNLHLIYWSGKITQIRQSISLIAAYYSYCELEAPKKIELDPPILNLGLLILYDEKNAE